MAELTHWRVYENPDYLGSYAFQRNQEMVLTINRVIQEDVFNPTSGKKESCTVCYWNEKNVKPMILNVTNCKTISKLYSTPFIEEWQGKVITVYVAQVKAFGDVVDALRIRTKIPTLKQLKCESCSAIVKGNNTKSAEEIAEISKRNCSGKVLCISCMNKEAERIKQDQVENKTENSGVENA